MRIKSAQQIDSKYRAAIGRVPGAYQEGIQRTTGWQAAAIAGESLYKEKLTEAMNANRRANALGQVSDEEWKRKASGLGAERIGRGMTENADKRTANYEPYRLAIEGLDLPAKTADPMANVTARVGAVVQKLVDTKKGIKG